MTESRTIVEGRQLWIVDEALRRNGLPMARVIAPLGCSGACDTLTERLPLRIAGEALRAKNPLIELAKQIGIDVSRCDANPASDIKGERFTTKWRRVANDLNFQ
jgi:hypothetical protein